MAGYIVTTEFDMRQDSRLTARWLKGPGSADGCIAKSFRGKLNSLTGVNSGRRKNSLLNGILNGFDEDRVKPYGA